MKKKLFGLILILAIITFFTQGCASLGRENAVPTYLQKKAQISGLQDIRYRAYTINKLAKEGEAAYLREKVYLESKGYKGPLPPANYLAISGGGDKGAFGAGVMVGWTAAGNRPEFKLVTGISTGALIAPFAFLGPKYDDQLQEVFTSVSPDDVMKKRPILAVIFRDALADSRPLWKLISKYANQQMLDDIAAEYRKGRLLLVGTTDLDAHGWVIWNLTKIAASGHPESLELFRNIVLASASIPAAFPPVMIEVEVDGEKYHEMHVDGGTSAQVFIYPPSLDIKKLSEEMGAARKRKLYVIRNSRLDPEWAEIERRTLKVAGRAISALIHSQGRGDLYTIYLLAKRDGIDFNLAYISRRFHAVHLEEFDNKYMNKLFDFGYDQASKGYHWEKVPPGYVE